MRRLRAARGARLTRAPLKSAKAIRSRILRGLALNRTPGFHFPGSFLDVSFDRVTRDDSRLSILPGPWCLGPDRQVDFASLAMLADLALASCLRPRVGFDTRLGTISLSLQFTGARRIGRLRAHARFEAFLTEAAGRLGMSRVAVEGDDGLICYGHGTFMVLKPPPGVALHPVPRRHRRSPEPPRLDPATLRPEERAVVDFADEVLAGGGNFVEGFWGARAVEGEGALRNGPHTANRVGHLQGGLLFSLSAQTAASALPPGWHLSGIKALYIRPGEGAQLRAKSTVLHQGGLTAVVRTEVRGRGRRRVLEVLSTHSAPARAGA